jgi:hydroxymethylpyrimidine/phosphomethylpyrimidine kinase
VYKVLTIAGSDCSGGAGIQADIKTITAHKHYAMSVITALTAQNTTGVFAVQEASPSLVAQQLDAIFTDIVPDAVKIGMVADAQIIQTIAERLGYYKAQHIVLDPVMVSSSGSALIADTACAVLQTELFPLAELVTPNLAEATALCGFSVQTTDDMLRAAKAIAAQHRCNVLVKGGHHRTEASDVLLVGDEVSWLCGTKIDTVNTHGTGCTLSAAIACGLAEGKTLYASVESAKRYVSDALAAGLDLGHGTGPLNHLVSPRTS